MHLRASRIPGLLGLTPMLLFLNYAPTSFADSAEDLAYAMDVPSNSLVSATFTALANSESAKVRTDWGVSTPFVGPSFFVLSTGRAADTDSPGYVSPAGGTGFSNSGTNPAAGQTTCAGTEASTGFDYTELQLVLNVPTNAAGFTLKFNFFSAEYPESVCSSYNDRFMVRLTSLGFNGNIAFDGFANPVSVNTAYFAVTNGAELNGTGMESGVGAATGWQTITSPSIYSGETITLKFLIFDGQDHQTDSEAVIDAFDWIPGTNPPPVTLAASIYHAVEIGWASETNKNYQVEWSPDVNATGPWNDLGPVVAGNGTTNYVFDSTRGVSNRFYRIREIP